MPSPPKNHNQISRLEYAAISDGIYIGTNQCCATHFVKILLRLGISADISLEEDRIDAPFGVKVYVWIPVKDHAPPSRDQISFGVAALEEFVRQGRKVYVHCKNGHGRAPTLIAAYLIKKGGLSPLAAVAFIKKRRPSIHLEKSQINALKKWWKIQSR